MPNSPMPSSHESIVSRQFGSQARAYLESGVHAGGEDLGWLEQLAAAVCPRHALDLGTGGGHVAYRLAPHARHVTACDLSSAMVAIVLETALERGLSNIAGEIAAAEALPFDADAFDLVASRLSAHHWRDFECGLREARRVLAPGGTAVFIDVVAPEEAAADTHLQSVELLRDPSHVRDYRKDEWLAALGRAGFVVQSARSLRLRMEFASWTARMRTPDAHVAAIRSLQSAVSTEIAGRFGIEPDGSFLLDTVAIAAG